MNWVVRPIWPRNFPGPLGNLFGDVHCSSQHISPLDSAVYRSVNCTVSIQYDKLNHEKFCPSNLVFGTSIGYSQTNSGTSTGQHVGKMKRKRSVSYISKGCFLHRHQFNKGWIISQEIENLTRAAMWNVGHDQQQLLCASSCSNAGLLNLVVPWQAVLGLTIFHNVWFGDDDDVGGCQLKW